MNVLDQSRKELLSVNFAKKVFSLQLRMDGKSIS